MFLPVIDPDQAMHSLSPRAFGDRAASARSSWAGHLFAASEESCSLLPFPASDRLTATASGPAPLDRAALLRCGPSMDLMEQSAKERK
jgi:hypothetical protein